MSKAVKSTTILPIGRRAFVAKCHDGRQVLADPDLPLESGSLAVVTFANPEWAALLGTVVSKRSAQNIEIDVAGETIIARRAEVAKATHAIASL